MVGAVLGAAGEALITSVFQQTVSQGHVLSVKVERGERGWWRLGKWASMAQVTGWSQAALGPEEHGQLTFAYFCSHMRARAPWS